MMPTIMPCLAMGAPMLQSMPSMTATPSLELTVPHVPYVLDYSSEEAKYAGLRHVCRMLLSDWKNVKDKDISIKEIQGGITNMLYRLDTTIKGKLDQKLVRIYGENTEQLIDREKELRLLEFAGSKYGLAVKLFGRFENGRIEEWLELRACDPEDMKDVSVIEVVTKSLVKLHKMDVPRPFDKQPVLWKRCDEWLAIASTISFDDDPKREKNFKEWIDLRKIRLEIAKLKKKLAPYPWKMEFCHNDLLGANVMLSKDRSLCKLIDFEYADYNYRGFDIGNHFNEYAGLDCDYSLYPNKETQFVFFRHYLAASTGKSVKEIALAELEFMYVEANLFALCSHLHWGVWSLVQAKYSKIDFDFLDYARLRFDAYFDMAKWALDLSV